MKRVTKDQFYAAVMGASFNIVSSIPPGSRYPYTTEFMAASSGQLVGKIVARYENPATRWPVVADYWLNEDKFSVSDVPERIESVPPNIETG